MPDLTSRPFRPNPEHACEACCFGSGDHAPWCPPASERPVNGMAQEIVWVHSADVDAYLKRLRSYQGWP